MALVLIVQAAALTSLVGVNDRQALGSLIWLACYLFMLIPPAIMAYRNPDMLIGSQRAASVRLPAIHFTGRKAALAFISTLPITGFVEGRWDWMDNFLPKNQRRKDWEKVIEAADLCGEKDAMAGGFQEDVKMSEMDSLIVKEVREKMMEKTFKETNGMFKSLVGLG
ncbi:hypothetical protein K491DRAFT_716836 [Lophiostoma macrostomum CBS 122681]|uniref:Uncharacterized protein n=1 Tax=Lophiostoma macrostomum CBS 122681 TaxID=1314788 RepID=A0A6A6T687_9PLEO|nr:hypothetical protein K491DRAFT_716836 [Lophiostoma macrostomum CBS 122681]